MGSRQKIAWVELWKVERGEGGGVCDGCFERTRVILGAGPK